jgi:hypothetical protein
MGASSIFVARQRNPLPHREGQGEGAASAVFAILAGIHVKLIAKSNKKPFLKKHSAVRISSIFFGASHFRPEIANL